MKKRFLLPTVLVTVLIVITACAGPSENTGPDVDAEPIEIETLLNRQGSFDAVLFTSIVDIDGRMTVYEMIPEGVSHRLAEALGTRLSQSRQWYTVSGHENKQYLIHKEGEDYSLWKFYSFQEEEYPYTDVLETIYNIRSAQDITEVIVSPANMDNTAAGVQLQREIGTVNITDTKQIAEVYEIISNLTCYGDNNWDLIDMGHSSEEGMLNQVRQGRYLTFVTAEGLKIDELKYTGISGTFYEYGGIAYNQLETNEKQKVDEILKIE